MEKYFTNDELHYVTGLDFYCSNLIANFKYLPALVEMEEKVDLSGLR